MILNGPCKECMEDKPQEEVLVEEGLMLRTHLRWVRFDASERTQDLAWEESVKTTPEESNVFPWPGQKATTRFPKKTMICESFYTPFLTP